MTERSVAVRIRAEIGDFRRQMQQASEATTGLGRAGQTAGQQMSTAMTRTQAEAAAARVALRNAGEAAQETAKGFGLSYNSAGQLTDRFGQLVTEAHAAELGLQTASDATREFAAQQQHAAAVAGEATTSMGRLAASARDHSDSWEKAGTTLLAFGAAVTAGVGLSIAKYASFDKAMSQVDAATHETAGNMGLLREAAIQAGADTAYSAEEAANAITALSKAGVTTKDILSGGLGGSMSLAAAGELEVADAAEIAATAMTQFGLKGQDIPHIADLLAAGAGKAQGEVKDLALALSYVGPVAAGMGVSIEETTGTLAAFAAQGIIGDKAGTGLRGMLASLTSPSKAASNEIERLGINLYDTDGKITGVKGKFLGLQNTAQQLQGAYKGMTDAERDFSLGIIFGNEQVTAARVLYKTGADGVKQWTNAVSESGYAADTARRMQNNLAGDIEKVGGSLDSVLIRSGSGANEVLRGLAQSANDLVNSIGQIPGPVLQTGLGFAGIVGGGALLIGTFVTLVPKAIETVAAFRALAAANPGVASGLGKVGKAASIAATALIALEVAGAVFTEKRTKSADEYANAILKVANAGKDAKASDLDSVFQGFDRAFNQDTVSNVNGMADAVARLSNHGWEKDVNQFFDGFTSMFGAKSDLGQIDDRLKGLGDTLGDLTRNGGAESAAKSFSLLTEEFKKNGKSAQDALDKLPGYRDALLAQAKAAGTSVEGQDLLDLAMGKIPAKMEAATAAQQKNTVAAQGQQQAAEEDAKALADMGLRADGTTASLSKLLDAMFATGLASMSARDAEAQYQEALDGLKKKTDEVLASQSAGNLVLNKTKDGFDLTSEAGRAANGVFGDMQQKAINTTKAMADAGATQPQLQAKLWDTYQALKNTAIGFGMGETKADDMARSALSIPKGVNINTAIQNYADSMAKLHGVGAQADALNGKRADIFIYTHQTTFQDVVRHLSGDTSDPVGTGTVLAPKKKADGGAIYGPGTGTSDEVPAWLSNGEHVLTADEVQKLGGQDAVYRFRALLNSGDLPKFATGGHIGESANARANRLYREAQAAAKKRAAAAKKRADELKKSAAYRSEQLVGLSLDDVRGQSYTTVDDSLSSAYSFSDRLRSVANSGNVPTQRAFLIGRANAGDEALRRLHARSDALGKSLDAAKQKLTDLTQVRAGVANALSGEFNIAKTAQRQGLFGAGAVANTIADAKGFLAKVQGFAGKLKKLQQKGFSGAIVQEIAALGTTAGTQAADSLLQATASQVKDLNHTMGSINAASLSAGNAVTDSLYRGGVNGAAANVKSLEAQEGAISKAMLQIGLGMENALRQALGGKPIKRAGGGAVYGPGTSTSDEVPALLSNGEHVLDAEDVKALGGQAGVYRLRAQLHHSPSKSLAGGYGQVQHIPAHAMGWAAPAPAAAAGLHIEKVEINDQSNPVATSHELARRLGDLRP